jgi:hypothetical protein
MLAIRRADSPLRMSATMTIETRLREKLRKVEQLFAGAGTTGERLAAEAALERLRAKLKEQEQRDPPIEMQFSIHDPWSRHLLIALCRRYGIRPYRYPRQRRTTLMVRAPRPFIEQVLLPQFRDLDDDLRGYLQEVTLKIIRDEVYADTSDAQDVAQALPAA